MPPPTVVPLALPAPAVVGDIQIELQRAGTTVKIVCAALAPMHPATEPAGLPQQARRRRYLKPCTALIVVSGAVARSPGEAAPSHREPLDANQTDSARNGVTPAPRDLAFDTAAWRCCRLCGCASVAGGWGDDHHIAAARVLAAPLRGL